MHTCYIPELEVQFLFRSFVLQMKINDIITSTEAAVHRCFSK